MAFDVGETVGPYQITERLGQGGMATVFKAYHANLDRYVALKVLHTGLKGDPVLIARFQREAQIIAKLEHPSIVPVYDYSEHKGEPYLIMKFIEGETLKAHLARQPLTLEEILRIMTAVAEALTYANERGVLHRDVKPSNILMEKRTIPYLADFGLARLASAGESTLSQDSMLGTPQYISPEQAKGVKDLTATTDVYSLGVVLYELVVGRVPFTGETAYAIVHDHIYTPLPMPSKINPQVPSSVERVLLKALAKERNDRYASAVEMVNAFRQAIRNSGLKELSTDTYRSIAIPVAPVSPATSDNADPARTAFQTPSPVAKMGSAPTTPTPPPTSGSASKPMEDQRKQRLSMLGSFVLTLTCLTGIFIALLIFANSQGLFTPPGAAPTPTSDNTQIALITASAIVTTQDSTTASVTPTDKPTTTPSATSTNTMTPTTIPLPTATNTPFPTPTLVNKVPTETPVPTKAALTGLSSVEAEALIAANPGDPRGYFALATAQARDNKSELAMESFQKGLDALQGDSGVAMEIGRELSVATGQGIPNGAVYLYSYALNASSDKDMAVREEAGQYIYRVMFNATQADQQMVVRLSETAKDSQSAVLIAFVALGFNQLGDTKTASDFMYQASFVNSDLPEVTLVRGLISASRGERERALADFANVSNANNAPAWVVEEAKRLSAQ